MTKPMKNCSDNVKVVTEDGRVYDAAGWNGRPVLAVINCCYSGAFMASVFSPNNGLNILPFLSFKALIAYVEEYGVPFTPAFLA